MNTNSVLDDFKKKTIKPVYVFVGEGDYLKRELEQKIKTFLVSPSLEFFNYEVFEGNERDAGSLIIKCKTPSFFDSVRLIVVKNADDLCVSQELTEYLLNPFPGTCLILMVQKSVPSLKKYEIRLDKLNFRERAEWIRKKVHELKKEITPEAVQFLLEVAGEELERLSLEIEKIAIFTGEKSLISREDAENACPVGSQEMNIFNLVDTIGNKNKKQALRIMKDLVLAEDTWRILNMIGRQFRLILQSKELMEKGCSQNRIAQEIEIKQSWLVGKLLGQARNFSRKALIDKFEILTQAEMDIKTGKRQPLFTLEILVSRLCN